MSNDSSSNNLDGNSLDNTSNTSPKKEHNSMLNTNYYNFFEFAPVPLWIEDFSIAKKFIDELIEDSGDSFNVLVKRNPELLAKLSAMIVVKDVNRAAIELYGAKSKEDLLGNLDKVFTEKSHQGFVNLIETIFSGEKEAVVASVNQTLDGVEFDVMLKLKIAEHDTAFENTMISCENISELVSSKKKLDLSESRYKQAQLLVKMGSWSFSFETNELYISEEINQFLGLDNIKKITDFSNYTKKIHPDDYKIFSNFKIAHLLENPTQELHYRVQTAEGDWKHIYEKRHCTISNGRILNVLSVCQNITEKVEDEHKFISTKNLFTNTLAGINDALVILDSNSNYIYINSRAANLLGKSVEELLGKNIWDEFPERKGDLFYDNYLIAKRENKPVSFENYFAPWDKWFDNRIVPSNEGIMIFFQEITDRKIRESKIKEAYNIINKSSSVAFLSRSSFDFPIEFVSENTKELFGYEANDFLNKTITINEVIFKDDLQYVSREITKRIRKKQFKNFKPNPFRIITKEDEIKWVHASIDFIKNERDELTHIQGIVEDITKQKVAEDLFFKSNQRLKDQFNNTPLASIMWDLDFRVIEWNNSAQRIFGYSFEEAVGRHAEELIIPRNIKIDIDKIWKSLLNQTGGYRNTNSNITKDGKLIICDWYNVTLKDAHGKVTGVASLVDDITERTLSKELLENSEKRYRDIFEQSFEAVLIIKNGIFVDCNESTLNIFGYKEKSNLLEAHPSELSPEFQSDGRNSFEKAEEFMQISLVKGSNRFIWDHQRKDGQIFPAEVTLTRIDDIDGAPLIHAMVKDITERVKKEMLEDVLYNISKAALTKGNFNEFCEFVKVELNKVIDTQNFFIALYDKDERKISTPFLAGVDQTDKISDIDELLTQRIIDSKKPLFLNRESILELLTEYNHGTSNVVIENWLGVPLRINERVFGAIVVQSVANQNSYNENDLNLLEFVGDQISTLIQRKKAENELKVALIKAQESDRLKSAFLANMSHEIRTPMNGIIGFSELFLKENLTNIDRKKYAEIVINSSKQLLSIVNDILDISKIEAGAVQLNVENVNINEMLDNLCSFYKPIAKEKNLELICVRGLENYQSLIKIDRIKLNQVLTNLLSNAFKFTEKGHVEFGYERIDEYLQFYVKDTGIGIDKKLEERIFDRFTQADVEVKKNMRGTGLGLSISKKFIELFNGKIWFADQDEGTKVLFTIPYTKIKNTELTTLADKSFKENRKTNNRNVTILVAEDEEYNMMYINEIFENEPFDLLEASNGQQAIDLIRKHPEIELVLLDIKMPVMDGNEAMKIIKAERKDLPIIALSAFAMQSDKERAIKKGFDDYMTKPIDKTKLFELINTYTG